MKEGGTGDLPIVFFTGTYTASRPSVRVAARRGSSGSTRGSPTTGRGFNPSSPPSTPEHLLPLPRHAVPCVAARGRTKTLNEVHVRTATGHRWFSGGSKCGTTGPVHVLTTVAARCMCVGEHNSPLVIEFFFVCLLISFSLNRVVSMLRLCSKDATIYARNSSILDICFRISGEKLCIGFFPRCKSAGVDVPEASSVKGNGWSAAQGDKMWSWTS